MQLIWPVSTSSVSLGHEAFMDTIAVTGATGYVGGRVLARAIPPRLVRGRCPARRPVPGTDFRFFDLADPVHIDLSGVRAIIHAAHDFSAVGPEIVERNLRGGEALLASAARCKRPPRVRLFEPLCIQGLQISVWSSEASAGILLVRARWHQYSRRDRLREGPGGIFGALRQRH